MGFNVPAETLKCKQVGYFVNKGDQEPVGIAHSVDSNLVGSVREGPVVAMSCNALIHNPQVHPKGLYKFRTWNYCPLRKIAFEDIAHDNKVSKIGMSYMK
jgi:hypothetical protein